MFSVFSISIVQIMNRNAQIQEKKYDWSPRRGKQNIHNQLKNKRYKDYRVIIQAYMTLAQSWKYFCKPHDTDPGYKTEK